MRGWTVAVAGAALASAAMAQEVTITAVAVGSPNPPPVFDQDILNGDFLILKNPEQQVTTGDGVDETTTWTIDFTGDPNFAAFPQTGRVTAATLSLTLTTPYAPGPITDLVRWGNFGVPSIPIPEFIPNGGTGRIEFDLLDYMCGELLLSDLQTHGFAATAYYADDAVVSFAQMRITAKPACEGDVDGDGDVDLSDLGVVLANFNGAVGCASDGDLDGNGVVDLSDLGIVLAAFGNVC